MATHRSIWSMLLIVTPWVPFLVSIGVFVPRFANVFHSLREQGELPAVTELVVRFGLWNQAWFFAPCLVLSTLLVAVNAAVAKLCQRLRWPYSAFLVLNVVLALLAFAVVFDSMLIGRTGPSNTM